MIVGGRVDDQVALMHMDAHGRFELGALPRERRHGRKRRENPDEIVDVTVRLLDGEAFGREPPDIVEIGESARRKSVLCQFSR